jgi:DNA-directed RNA polymerase specialized sigma24 family protein
VSTRQESKSCVAAHPARVGESEPLGKSWRVGNVGESEPLGESWRVGNPGRTGKSGRLGLLDPLETVALVARSRRELLLSVHRHRLAREDLEDCYSQATLELLIRARRREAFAGRAHIANALEQRLLSRIHDRRRALGGRSPIEAAIATALPLACDGGQVDIADTRADVERLVLLRHELRRIGASSRELSPDQRLVLANQLVGETDCGEFCRIHGWSVEKYRKVAQRARARLAAARG